MFHKECEAIQLPQGYDIHRGVRLCYDDNIEQVVSKGVPKRYWVLVSLSDINHNDFGSKDFEGDTIDEALIHAYRYIEENTKIKMGD